MSVETETTETIETPEIEEHDADLQSADEVPDEEAKTPAPQEVTDEVVVTIGDAEPEQEAAAPQWVRDVRKQNRELQRELRELKARQQAPADVPVLGKKPTLEDVDYDSEKFEADLVSWHAKKQRIEQIQQQREQQAQQQQAEWQQRLSTYSTQRAALKVQDFDDAESLAQDVFSQTQQGVILQGADNPALLVYALGKNPAKAKELAAITDPVKFSFAVAKLETQLKTAPRKPAAAPEKTVTASGGASGNSSARKLEQLRAEASKTGDRTKVAAFMRSMKKT